jgi:predicted nuclease with TOPRIM domain
LKRNLMHPDYVKEFIQAYHLEFNRRAREREAGREQQARKLERVRQKLDRLIDAIADGLRTPALKERLEGLEAEKAELETKLQQPPTQSPRLHPNMAEIYRRNVERLHEVLRDPATADEAVAAARSLIDRIVMTPMRDGFEIELVGAIANMVALTIDGTKPGRLARQPASLCNNEFLSSVKVVAGARYRFHLLATACDLPQVEV